MQVSYSTKKTKQNIVISQSLLLDLLWMQCLEQISSYSLYPKLMAVTIGQHTIISQILILSIPISPNKFIPATQISTLLYYRLGIAKHIVIRK